MSAQNRTLRGAAEGVLGLIGLSALAGVLVTATVTPALAVTGMAANSSISMFENLPGYLEIDDLSQKSTIYAKYGADWRPIASFFDQNREEVAWDDISQYVKDAAISGEDPRFYEHGGVDLQGTIRGAVSTYVLNRDVQGGSSITQQYIKNVLIQQGIAEATTAEEEQAAYLEATATTPERKLKEIRYAITLEKQFTKDEVLLGYLNIAHFGGRVYGIESAAKYYFDKSASELSLAQAASLIAIVNNPEKFRLDYPDSETNGAETVNADGESVPYAANMDRRNYILGEMLEYQKITQEEYDEAIATPVEPTITEPSTGCQSAGDLGYFCDYVTWEVRNKLDDPETEDVNEGLQLLQKGGLNIYTTIDTSLQKAAVATMKANVPSVDARFDVGSTAVSVQPGTGDILAMTQNKTFSNDPDVLAKGAQYSAVNYNTDYAYGGSSGFQPGSTYKVFTLAEWLNEGHSLLESFNGQRREFTHFTNTCDGDFVGSFDPKNDDGRVATNSVDATKWSVNTSFVAMAQQLDLCGIKETAQAFGIHRADGNPLQMNPSDVLGTQEIAPVTMAAAYAGIANNGLTCEPNAIKKIRDAEGEAIYSPEPVCTQSVTTDVAAAMQYAMQQTFAGGGTAVASNTYSGVAHIGKTGTTDDSKDTWMNGASTKVATAVWVGHVTAPAGRQVALRNIYWDSGPAATARHRMWKDIMTVADAKYGGEAFPEANAEFFKQVLIDIPDVVGLTPEAAQTALEEAGFVYEEGKEEDSSQPEGRVSSISPEGQAGRGTVIIVNVSNGKVSAVPDVVGMTEQAARDQLSGYNVRVREEDVLDPTKDGVVISQDPGGGQEARQGSRVTIVIGRFVVDIGGGGDGGDGGTGNGTNGGGGG
ncbi:carboxypeptidase [Agromyces rhizosphaerae]|uniref:Carboxypeptidase n=1 Tax=Agromyces rhizosphaerae TaxID=88374 RepID=A0A9W6CP43_9MICO|nr:transglycosylase domain-containing protein [Agromyces rhizosphaerae]GLI26186.1 carboxypeptidase [Agromyces rhizosphaerae]